MKRIEKACFFWPNYDFQASQIPSKTCRYAGRDPGNHHCSSVTKPTETAASCGYVQPGFFEQFGCTRSSISAEQFGCTTSILPVVDAAQLRCRLMFASDSKSLIAYGMRIACCRDHLEMATHVITRSEQLGGLLVGSSHKLTDKCRATAVCGTVQQTNTQSVHTKSVSLSQRFHYIHIL